MPPAGLDAFKLPHHAKLTCHIRSYSAKYQAPGNLFLAFILQIIFAAFNCFFCYPFNLSSLHWVALLVIPRDFYTKDAFWGKCFSNSKKSYWKRSWWAFLCVVGWLGFFLPPLPYAQGPKVEIIRPYADNLLCKCLGSALLSTKRKRHLVLM